MQVKKSVIAMLTVPMLGFAAPAVTAQTQDSGVDCRNVLVADTEAGSDANSDDDGLLGLGILGSDDEGHEGDAEVRTEARNECVDSRFNAGGDTSASVDTENSDDDEGLLGLGILGSDDEGDEGSDDDGLLGLGILGSDDEGHEGNDGSDDEGLLGLGILGSDDEGHQGDAEAGTEFNAGGDTSASADTEASDDDGGLLGL
jgi:hypothetical protein